MKKEKIKSPKKPKVEIWRPVVGYPKYEVSNWGRVRNAKSGLVRVPFVNNCDYYQVNLCLKKDLNGKAIVNANGKKVQYVPLIARLVAEAFIPNPNGYEQVNHIDEDKSHNYSTNLEWVSRPDNINHGTRNKRQGEYAKNMSPEHKKKLSEAAQNRSSNNSGMRMVDLTDEKGNVKSFPHARAAARFLKINPSRLHYNNDNGRYIEGYKIHKLTDDEMRERVLK